MSTVFIGWDVGAWGGERKARKDCISLIVNEEIFVGNCINISNVIFSYTNMNDFFKKLLDDSFDTKIADHLKKCLYEASEIIIAADAVMSLPKGINKLYALELDVENENSFKQLLFRDIERTIINNFKDRNNWPKASCLSVIRDSIGSHSVKMLTFLKRFNFTSLGMNVFRSNQDSKYLIFETYPGFYIKHPDKDGSLQYYDFENRKMQELELLDIDVPWTKDQIDSAICCLIARDLKGLQNDIQAKKNNCYNSNKDGATEEVEEDGFIWLPKKLDLSTLSKDGCIKKGSLLKAS